MKLAMKIIIGGSLILMASCGPSAEEIATMTASAWTPTPTQTPIPPSPTPLPIDVTVTVMDESGAPVAGASISFPESGNDTPVLTDETGQVRWNDLPGETGTFNVTAQGYLPVSSNSALVRGPNEVTVTIQRDPFALLPSQGCAQGETFLYAEDFQDGKAQGWMEIEFGAPGWSIAPSAEEAGDLILSAQYTDMVGDAPMISRLDGMEFDNAVWRIQMLISKTFSQENWFSLNWKQALQPFTLGDKEIFDSRYQLPIGYNYFALRRLQQPVTNIGIAQSSAPKAGDWHIVEIATYQGVTEVWLDGKQKFEYEDPVPVPPGTMGLELWLQRSQTIVYFDDIFACDIDAPFVSIVPAVP
ncbi:MAG: hypothetical protein JETCAE01_16470 [Anaerolineaceae bacterium]|nr:MAG: hypothetical protein JETCAE01_16470 [Anaerolineaceae bacterium]